MLVYVSDARLPGGSFALSPLLGRAFYGHAVFRNFFSEPLESSVSVASRALLFASLPLFPLSSSFPLTPPTAPVANPRISSLPPPLPLSASLALPHSAVTQSEPFNLAIYAHILPSAPATAPDAAPAHASLSAGSHAAAHTNAPPTPLAAAAEAPAAPAAAAARGADGRRVGARALEDGGTGGVGMCGPSAGGEFRVIYHTQGSTENLTTAIKHIQASTSLHLPTYTPYPPEASPMPCPMYPVHFASSFSPPLPAPPPPFFPALPSFRLFVSSASLPLLLVLLSHFPHPLLTDHIVLRGSYCALSLVLFGTPLSPPSRSLRPRALRSSHGKQAGGTGQGGRGSARVRVAGAERGEGGGAVVGGGAGEGAWDDAMVVDAVQPSGGKVLKKRKWGRERREEGRAGDEERGETDGEGGEEATGGDEGGGGGEKARVEGKKGKGRGGRKEEEEKDGGEEEEEDALVVVGRRAAAVEEAVEGRKRAVAVLRASVRLWHGLSSAISHAAADALLPLLSSAAAHLAGLSLLPVDLGESDEGWGTVGRDRRRGGRVGKEGGGGGVRKGGYGDGEEGGGGAEEEREEWALVVQEVDMALAWLHHVVCASTILPSVEETQAAFTLVHLVAFSPRHCLLFCRRNGLQGLLSALQQPRSPSPSSSSRPSPSSAPASSSFLSSSAASSLPCLALSALLCCCRHPFACALLLQPDPRVPGKGAIVKGSSAGRKGKGVTGPKKEGDEGGEKRDGGAEKKGEGVMEVEGEGVEEEEEAVEEEQVSTGKEGKQGGEGKAEAGKSAGGKEKGAGSSGYEQVLAFVVHSSRCRTPLQVGVLATQLLLVLHRHHLCLRLQVILLTAAAAAAAAAAALAFALCAFF
ncbi:unnamed protein product [Closterium sp. Naga37s-1]|nr:unnamed protein product [Closterium sp. Naga37s-1]